MFKYSYCFCIWDIQKIAPVGSLLQSSILGVLPTYRLQHTPPNSFIYLFLPPCKERPSILSSNLESYSPLVSCLWSSSKF
ncbi:hypothetical protein HanRHA438_Chr08g0370641 [Helianthus annuus]|uniref:Uncharacterized protein n=1 Tax=Helianthus annuus TaxID=4232 RepID=A0A251UBF4_HELAN|nr:hypothetical protein HanXRQr2_Chr08g0358591 [Helianthus annuus]KAJ0540247.1 hypothetical protein HanHA300_Chr08g0296051 [Helianthus annuus]KAJ0548737.1 hypothetical protein HanIR_Chr08g0387141 [Helianthus annuus]KAJ0554992.1 hypothetical protein HanHA89_Chr08g0314571 [Helianthus annuus]KAJ0720560.1 hypothetical protein HanLR1_Chr08g0294931 [Helianthus annuus]